MTDKCTSQDIGSNLSKDLLETSNSLNPEDHEIDSGEKKEKQNPTNVLFNDYVEKYNSKNASGSDCTHEDIITDKNKGAITQIHNYTDEKTYNLQDGKQKKYYGEEPQKSTINLLRYTTLPKNSFIYPNRFRSSLRDYLLDILLINDKGNKIHEQIKKEIDVLTSNIPFKETYNNIETYSDDYVIYFIYYALDKISEMNGNNEKKAEVMVRIIYVIVFYGLSTIKEKELEDIKRNEASLKKAFETFFGSVKHGEIENRKKSLQVNCDNFVKDVLCAKHNYRPRTQMYRLLTGMQSCIYDGKEVDDILFKKNQCEHGDSPSPGPRSHPEFVDSSKSICDFLKELRNCDEYVLHSDEGTDRGATVNVDEQFPTTLMVNNDDLNREVSESPFHMDNNSHVVTQTLKENEKSITLDDTQVSGVITDIDETKNIFKIIMDTSKEYMFNGIIFNVNNTEFKKMLGIEKKVSHITIGYWYNNNLYGYNKIYDEKSDITYSILLFGLFGKIYANYDFVNFLLENDFEKYINELIYNKGINEYDYVDDSLKYFIQEINIFVFSLDVLTKGEKDNFGNIEDYISKIIKLFIILKNYDKMIYIISSTGSLLTNFLNYIKNYHVKDFELDGYYVMNSRSRDSRFTYQYKSPYKVLQNIPKNENIFVMYHNTTIFEPTQTHHSSQNTHHSSQNTEFIQLNDVQYYVPNKVFDDKNNTYKTTNFNTKGRLITDNTFHTVESGFDVDSWLKLLEIYDK